MIYHFGEYSRVESSYEDYPLVMENNLGSFSHILLFAKKYNSKKVYSGSSTKFADSFGGPEASPYSFTKDVNTKHLVNYAKWFGINFAIVYFYNIYGGREIANGKYATLIGKYKKMISKGIKELPVVSPGTQLRYFTHYTDVVKGLCLVGDKGDGDNFGIGSDECFSVLDVVEILGCTPKMVPARPGNRLSGELVVDKTKDLGWKAMSSLPIELKNFQELISKD